MSNELLDQLEAYPVNKRDMFANWQRHWTVLHIFFYRDKILETTQLYLQQLAAQLITDLDIKDYQAHTVDFYGANNFGTNRCWIALYPLNKLSHKDAYQFFVSIASVSEAGRVGGYEIEERQADMLTPFQTYEELVPILTSVKAGVFKLNNSIRNYFKFSPGSQAVEWDRFYREQIVALIYSGFDLGDLNEFASRAAINEAVGLDHDSSSNQTWNLWLLKTANAGDIVFANKGVNTCIGIGVIVGEYYFEADADDYRHRRKVTWITDKVIQYKGGLKGYKTLFRPDTFSPTKVWAFLINEYIRTYPELTGSFEKYNLLSQANTGNSFNPSIEKKLSPQKDIEAEAAEPEPQAFWWLNANPEIWSINTLLEGDTQSYTTHNEKGNKRRVYKHFQAVKPGDLMIGYETSPIKQIKAIYEITKGIHTTTTEKKLNLFCRKN